MKHEMYEVINMVKIEIEADSQSHALWLAERDRKSPRYSYTFARKGSESMTPPFDQIKFPKQPN